MVVRGRHNGWCDSKVLPSGEGDIVKSEYEGIDMDVSGFCHGATGGPLSPPLTHLPAIS